MPEETLTDFSNRYGSDKGTVGPSTQWGAHNYTDIYQAYLEKYRFSEVAILEIGLGVVGDKWDAFIVHGQNRGGASLKMWHDYFQSGKIFGVDVNPCAYLDNARTKTFVANQGSISDLDAFTEATKGVDFDIIVDDGSHRPDHQQISLSYLFKRLKSGGLYFIEDLTSNGLGDGVQGRHACDTVNNTRSVLKHYRKHGRFLEPNALADPAYLAANIAYVNFHVPEWFVEVEHREGRQRHSMETARYRPKTERLCAIQKR